jgi:PAS domain S-box-containing protein
MNVARDVMSQEFRLLILEDRVTDAELCQEELRRAGLHFTARRVETQAGFEAALGEFHPDLILADFVLPGAFDGLVALELAQAALPRVPFVFVSGAIGEERAVEAIKLGASDCVLKDRLGRLGPAVLRALEGAQLRKEMELAETALLASEIKYRELIEQAADGIFVTDRAGKILLANPRLCEMTGYGNDELTGLNIAATYPEEERAGLPGRIAQLAVVRTRLFERMMRRQDGSSFPVEVSVKFLANGTHQGVVRDITERRSQERQLLALTQRLTALQETERRSLARELHDRVGQNLTVLGINLTRLRGEKSAPAETQARIDDCLAVLEATGKVISDVLTELKPPMLSNHGLPEALRWHAKQLAQRAGIAIEITDSAIPRIASDIEMALFRIAQSALNNAVQHAGARNIGVRLDADEAGVRLEVTDDGAGFDASWPAISTRWGLATMKERAEAIDGSLRIESAPGRGTRIIVEAPIGP